MIRATQHEFGILHLFTTIEVRHIITALVLFGCASSHNSHVAVTLSIMRPVEVLVLHSLLNPPTPFSSHIALFCESLLLSCFENDRPS